MDNFHYLEHLQKLYCRDYVIKIRSLEGNDDDQIQELKALVGIVTCSFFVVFWIPSER